MQNVEKNVEPTFESPVTVFTEFNILSAKIFGGRGWQCIGVEAARVERGGGADVVHAFDGDVGDASNIFSLYVRCTYSNHGRLDGSSGRGCAPIFLAGS